MNKFKKCFIINGIMVIWCILSMLILDMISTQDGLDGLENLRWVLLFVFLSCINLAMMLINIIINIIIWLYKHAKNNVCIKALLINFCVFLIVLLITIIKINIYDTPDGFVIDDYLISLSIFTGFILLINAFVCLVQNIIKRFLC